METMMKRMASEAIELSETTLGEIASFEMGQAPPGEDCNMEGRGTVFVKAGEFGELYPEKKEWTTKPLKYGKEGDVFICVVGATTGKLNLGIDCAIGRSVAAIRPNAGYDARFVYYQLLPSVLRLRASSAGSAQGVLSKKQLSEIPFVVAPLPEQRRIVSAIETQLGRLDAAVARLHAAKAKLKRYKQAVLKAAYDQAAETYETKTFVELKAFSMYGPRFSSDDYASEGVPVLRTSDIDDRGRVNMTTAPKLQLSNEQVAKYKLRLGDLLITRTGSIGTVSVFNDKVDAIAGAFLIQYRLRGIEPWYAFHFLRGPIAQHHLIGNIAGIGRPNLNVAAIDSLEIPVPPMEEQKAIRKRIEERLDRVAAMESTLDAQLLQSTRLRQAVLKRAFEGRLG